MTLRWIGIALKAVISSALLWFVFSRVDVGGVFERTLAASPVVLAAVLFVLGAQVFVAAYRWHRICVGIGAGIGLAFSTRLSAIGLFFNQALPGSVGGDVMRIWLAHRSGLSRTKAVTSVAVDRLAGFMGLLILIAGSLWWSLRIVSDPVGRWSLVATIAALAAGFGMIVLVAGPLRRWVERLPLGVNAVTMAGDAMRTLASQHLAPTVLTLSVLLHCMTIFIIYLLAIAIGASVSAGTLLILVPPVLLISVVPVSIAGWGVREGAMVVALGYGGVAAADALALSVTFGLALLAISLPGGFVWLLHGRRGAPAKTIDEESDSAIESRRA